jgi:magnesium-transporting ATPase (P-type)
MLKILAICFAALVFGVLLSFNSLHLPIRPGYIAAILMVGSAVWVKQYWRRRARDVGDEPNAAERNAWLWMVGTAMISGFVIAVLFQPGSEIHTATGDTGGYDSWLILGGIVIAYTILRNPDLRRDERDIAISNFGTKTGYYALIILLVIFLLSLGFAPHELMQRFTHWLIANVMVTLIMLSCLVQYVAQLMCYWLDMRNLRADR